MAGAECVSPGLPAGMAATPEAEGMPDASPAAEAAPVGTPADDETTAAVTATVENYAACYNTGDGANIVGLESPNYWAENYGTSDPAEAAASYGNLPDISAELLSVEDVMTYDDGRVSADVEVLLGGHNFLHETMFFTQDMASGTWLLDEERYLTPEPDGDSTVVGVAIGTADDPTPATVAPNAASVEAWPVVIFHAMNATEESAELVVFILPEGADPAGLADGSLAMDQVQVIGYSGTMAPGEQRDIALVNLEPGVYTLVAFGESTVGSTTIEVTARAT
jgi:hypothetical protein